MLNVKQKRDNRQLIHKTAYFAQYFNKYNMGIM